MMVIIKCNYMIPLDQIEIFCSELKEFAETETNRSNERIII